MDDVVNDLKRTLADIKKPKRSSKPPVQEERISESERTITEDRSAFNCGKCAGEGMIFNAIFPEGKICDHCYGTGKV